jgi:hypothetical protein
MQASVVALTTVWALVVLYNGANGSRVHDSNSPYMEHLSKKSVGQHEPLLMMKQRL